MVQQESNFPIKMMGCLGKHGPYTFYKSIKVGDRTYSLSQFMPVKIWPDSAMLNIADIQYLWSDKTDSFCCLKLYFLPENTPDGRLKQHGEDEVVALQETVIIRTADLMSILVDESEWDWGFKTPEVASSKPLTTVLSKSFVNEQLSCDKQNGTSSVSGSNNIVVLSYQRYTRLRAILKRLEGSPDIEKWVNHPLVLALGGLNVGPNCRILYSKESFDHPDIEDNEIFCNHLGITMPPKLKGRSRKKFRNRNPSHGSISSESSSGSRGSSKENDMKASNGTNITPTKEFDIKPDIASIKEASRRRGSIATDVSKVELKGWSSRDGGSKRGSRTNGLSSTIIDPSVVVKTEGGDWESNNKGKVQLLGPALTELAQKLERSNALQILPIRPPGIEDDLDNIVPTKKRKTENSIALECKTGPFSYRSEALPAPGDAKPKRLQPMFEEPDKSVLTPAHAVPMQRVKANRTERLEQSWKPLAKLTGVGSCPYTPLKHMFGDPSDIKRQFAFMQQRAGHEMRSLDIMDYSDQKTLLGHKSSLMMKNSHNSDLPDRMSSGSSKLTASEVGVPSSSPMGVRLTSEVTLFPSKHLPSYPSALDGVTQQNFANPRHSANVALSTAKAAPEIDIQPWKPSSAAGSSSSSSRSFNSGMKEHVTARKQSPSIQSSSSKGASNQSSQGQSSSSKQYSSRERRDSGKTPPIPQQLQSPFMHPYLGKMDPAYLQLLACSAPLFMPPPPPPSFMAIPGAVEQFYKDFFLQAQGLPSGFSGFLTGNPGYPPAAGNDRGGPKS